MTHQAKYHFRVGWKFKNKKADAADYSAASLKELLQLIDKSEGISIRTTDYLYVHQVLATGGIKEVLAHDENTGAVHVDFSNNGVQPGSSTLRDQHKVVNTVGDLLTRAAEVSAKEAKHKKKPRVRLKTAVDPKASTPSRSSFFYTAYEAGHQP